MRQKIALVASIALGLITVFAMKMYLEQQRQENKKSDIKPIKVIISAKPLSKGQVVGKQDFRVISIPSEYASSDMLKPDERMQILGKTIVRDVNRESILMGSDFIRSEVRTASLIRSGKRLMSISVDPVSGVAGLIKPGSKIDILWTQALNNASGGNDSRTLTILSNVAVYAVDQKTSHYDTHSRRRKNMYSSITIFVTPEEGPMLVTAQESGKLTMMLRSNEDPLIVEDIKPVLPKDIEVLSKKAMQLRKIKKE